MEGENALSELLAQDLDRHFRQLVLDYQDQLYAFALRLVGNAPDAEDIVQDALLGSYIALSHYPVERICTLKLRPWLYKITLNVFRNHRRRARSLVGSLDDSEECLDLPDTEDEQPENLFEDTERQQEAVDLIYALPEQYRLVIICYYFEELSYLEIAKLLDLPLGTVKSRLHRGIQIMRQNLSQRRDSTYGTC